MHNIIKSCLHSSPDNVVAVICFLYRASNVFVSLKKIEIATASFSMKNFRCGVLLTRVPNNYRVPIVHTIYQIYFYFLFF